MVRAVRRSDRMCLRVEQSSPRGECSLAHVGLETKRPLRPLRAVLEHRTQNGESSEDAVGPANLAISIVCGAGHLLVCP